MKLIIATALFAAGLALPGAAMAQSSIAIGEPDSIAQDGVAFGITANYEDHDEADVGALDACRTVPNTSEEARALCKVVARYDNKCVSISLDPEPGTPGFGWAIANTQKEADDAAITKCRAVAGERAKACVLSVRQCDGNAS